jgi:hypothetical protein
MNLLLKRLAISGGLIAVTWTFSLAFPVVAGPLVVPNSAAATEAGNNNSYPFDLGEAGLTSQRYQQVYDAGQFATIPGGGYITQILFRPDTGIHGFAFSSTLGSVRIDLSTTSAGVNGLNTTFANNPGLDAVPVYLGGLPLSSACTGPVSGPKDFDIVINLRTPFYYSPARGNLLMDVWNYNGGSSTYFDAINSFGDSVSRLYTFLGYNATSGQTDSAGLVTAFTIVPPALGFNLSSANLVLSWTTNAVGWHLQSASSPSDVWSEFTVSTQIQGTNTVATVPTTNTLQFFRLHFP